MKTLIFNKVMMGAETRIEPAYNIDYASTTEETLARTNENDGFDTSFYYKDRLCLPIPYMKKLDGCKKIFIGIPKRQVSSTVKKIVNRALLLGKDQKVMPIVRVDQPEIGNLSYLPYACLRYRLTTKNGDAMVVIPEDITSTTMDEHIDSYWVRDESQFSSGNRSNFLIYLIPQSRIGSMRTNNPYDGLLKGNPDAIKELDELATFKFGNLNSGFRMRISKPKDHNKLRELFNF